jgi:hypothetical protein
VIAPKPPVPTEADTRRAIGQYLRLRGFAVYDLEQGYRAERGGTRQTPGVSDLIVMGRGRITFAEIKRGKAGRMRPAQVAFGEEVRANGGEYVVWRSLDDAIAWVGS